MHRKDMLRQLRDHSGPPWDLVVIGGGATGLGVALDSASRGYRTVLFEQEDFAKGTSSRSTKLAHGGVRYLQEGDVGLVREALRERGLLLKNAPHLVRKENFIIPLYTRWEAIKYTLGLMLYDLLSGTHSFGPSRHISREEVLSRLPGIRPDGLRGGVRYLDGKFNDARLALNLAQTAIREGALVLNYMRVRGLLKDMGGRAAGVSVTDAESGEALTVPSRAVVNATGVFVDSILALDNPSVKLQVRPSQGVHLVLDASFLGSADALLIPRTEDGRVLFGVPWETRLLVGTTDTPLDEHSLEPRALEPEVDFILRTAGRYFSRQPGRGDVRSVFAGLRPLAAPKKAGSSGTKEISRSHKILVSPSGIVTITGGKWTTYRKMGEDTVDRVIREAGLTPRPCRTRDLPIHGATAPDPAPDHLSEYGSDREALLRLAGERPEYTRRLHPDLPYTGAEVVWAVRHEYARTVEDVLARRTRALFLDARAAMQMAPAVASLMAGELGRNGMWIAAQVDSFEALARGYILTP